MVRTGFTRKKVESLTLGEKLQRIRREYRISLNEVAKHTKIQAKYLEYLERGEYEKLPHDVYVRGFLRSYARYLGANEGALLRLYEKERNIRANLKKDAFSERPRHIFRLPSFAITPALIIGIFGFLLIAGGFYYLYREYRAFASAPYLLVYEPTEGQIVPGPNITVRGRTDREAALTLNQQVVRVQDNGEFSEEVRLQPGLNTLTLVSVNKFQREAVKTVSLQADYVLTPAALEVPPVPEKLRLEISVTAKNIVVVVVVDGKEVYNNKPEVGKVQTFEAEREIAVSGSDGSQVLVKVNGSEPQPLIDKKGPVKDKVFARENQE